MNHDHRSLWQRLRPFIRRDLKGQLISTAIVASVIAGLCWFSVLAFTNLDNAAAKQLRVRMGLETSDAVCQQCTFDDRSQDIVEHEWLRDRKIRAAVLHELELRIEGTLANLTSAETLLARETIDFADESDTHLNELRSLLTLPDLRPLSWQTIYLDDGTAIRSPVAAAHYDSFRDSDAKRTQHVVESTIDAAREQLGRHQQTIQDQRERDREPASATGEQNRNRMLASAGLSSDLIGWFTAGNIREVSSAASSTARLYPAEFVAAIDLDSAIWAGGWQLPEQQSFSKPRIRYHSPITDEQRLALLGTLFLAFASVVLLVVGPVVSATATAREREAGTMPVLRMTGMSCDDLALAMILGPNMFALVLGGTMLVAGTILVGLTTSSGLSVLLPLLTLLVLTATTHVTAIALGDALGQRVSAMVVGALVGMAVLVPGLIGTLLAALDVTATGLLFGPLPAPLALFADFSGIQSLGIARFDNMTAAMFGYSLAVQLALGSICLTSWRRRVEQGWAPLFRPSDGVLLALACIGCSALTLLEVSARQGTQNFDTLNALTLMANLFLLPPLGWLLVTSLRRPARARAVASHIEALRGFLRFQGFVLATATVVGITYCVAMSHAGLLSDKSELMWATLGQLLLLAETSAAVLLWAARRRQNKLSIAFVGGAVLLMQIISVIGTYLTEVEHVARTNSSARVMLLGVEVSPYWMAFLVLCWAAGIALILTALARNREDQRVTPAPTNDPIDDLVVEDDDSDEGLPGRRLIH